MRAGPLCRDEPPVMAGMSDHRPLIFPLGTSDIALSINPLARDAHTVPTALTYSVRQPSRQKACLPVRLSGWLCHFHLLCTRATVPR